MNGKAEENSNLSAIKLALSAKEIRSKTRTLDLLNAEPIAVIGLACRFPGGARDPESFWQILRKGVDAITEVPSSRWDLRGYYDPDPEAAGKIYCRYGGFVDEVDKFDAQFFRITPREAASLDPQQRMLLEVAWSGLEDAGQAPLHLAGSQTGVFVGITTSDYLQLYLGDGNPGRIDAHGATGNSLNAAAGRLSYVMGLQGPSMAIDTACSSSLVAVHLACQSLRSGESDLALAGGVNLILTPAGTVALCRARMLAPDGRCKAFDASADGYVRSDGCGIVVLKRLSDALRDGDRIRAVVRASAVNQDGSSSGLTVPNGIAQEKVIRKALSVSGIRPEQVQYVEAHGTGTALGDPIEVHALSRALCQGRSDEQRLLIGSVKTNIGHLEAAAGVAGLIKLVLCLEKEEIPAQLHFQNPNPHISFDESRIKIVSEVTSWPSAGGRRIGGLSSFGASGTNAHVLVEEAPRTDGPRPTVERPLQILCLSARSEEALRQQANSYLSHLQLNGELSFPDVCHTAGAGRNHFNNRLAIVCDSSEDALLKMKAYLSGSEAPGLIRRRGPDLAENMKVAFLFTGQGSQYAGMGRELFETQPFFRRTMQRCDDALAPLLGRSIIPLLYEKAGEGLSLNDTGYTQPALFALEYALAQLWLSWGIEPAAVIGHSLGEYTAACVAGVFSLEDASRLIAERAKLMQALPRGGAMMAVYAEAGRVAEKLVGFDDRVSIASVNGPENTVISGADDALGELALAYEAAGIRTTPLVVSHAFHSPLIEPVLEPFERVAREVSYSPPRIELISNVTGSALSAKEPIDASYWRRHTRDPVRFQAGMLKLAEQECRFFLEIGPGSTLVGMGRRCLEEGSGVWLPSLREGRGDWQQMLESLGTLYAEGVDVDWRGFDREYPRRKVSLPTYPFQREKHWVRPSSSRRGIIDETALTIQARPFPGRCTRSPLIREVLFECEFSTVSLPFLDDHRIYRTVVVPASSHVSRLLAASQELSGSEGVHVLEDVTFPEAIVLSEEETRLVQLVLSREDAQTHSFRVISLPSASKTAREPGALHADGRLRFVSDASAPEPVALGLLQERLIEGPPATESLYPILWERGFHLGNSFRWIRRLWRKEGEALCRMELPSAVADSDSYPLHPGLIDSCFQLLAATLLSESHDLVAYAPIGLRSFRFHMAPTGPLWCHATLRGAGQRNQETYVGDLRLLEESGNVVGEVEGLCVKRAPREALLRGMQSGIADWLYALEWERMEAAAIPATSGEERSSPARVVQALEREMDEMLSKGVLKSYDRFVKEMDQLSLGYVLKAFADLGWELEVGERFHSEEKADRLGVVPEHRRLFGRLLQMLEEERLLSSGDGKERKVTATAETVDLRRIRLQIESRYPALKAELGLLRRCGDRLADVLAGHADPLQLLFPEGSLEAAERLYEDSPFSRAYNGMVAEVVERLMQNLPAARKVRILEIGAGTGGTTGYVLPRLSPARVEYFFTDVSGLFVNKAERKFSRYPFVQYRILDIERSPVEQGFERESFDLVIAANVLHATADLRQTLTHVRTLLRSDGVLVLFEGTGRHRWIDLVFGLTEGWWKFRDADVRPDYPLIPSAAWLKLLKETGFVEGASLPKAATTEGRTARPAIITARSGPPLSARSADGGAWVICADRGGVGNNLAERLRGQGRSSVLVYASDNYRRDETGDFYLEAAHVEDLERFFAEKVAEGPEKWKGVVYLWPLDAMPAPEMTLEQLDAAQTAVCAGALHLVQAMVKSFGSRLPLWIVTRGAQAAGSGEWPLSIAQSTLLGFARVIALEHPGLRVSRIDLDPTDVGSQVDELLSEIIAGDSEEEFALRGKSRYAPRLVHTSAPARSSSDLFRSDATYLITGGLGGLGRLVARWMIDQGARNLVLTGRTASDSAAASFEDMARPGVQLQLMRADVSKENEVAGLLEAIKPTMPALRGIIHAAGVLDDGMLMQQTWSRFAAVMAPKVRGSWILHRLTLNMPLDFFVLFSSAISLLGSAGQANHAAASAFQDALAHHRRRSGLPAVVINWGGWAEVGAVARGGHDAQLAHWGMGVLSPQQGLEALGLALQGSHVQLVVLPVISWRRFVQHYPQNSVPLLLSNLMREGKSQERPAPSLSERNLLLPRWRNTPPADRRDRVISDVSDETVRVLGFGPQHHLEATQKLFEIGMDSLMALELRNRLQNAIGLTLPSTLVFEYPTVEALSDYLIREVVPAGPQIGHPAEESKPDLIASGEDIDELDELTDDEITALIDKEIDALGRKDE